MLKPFVSMLKFVVLQVRHRSNVLGLRLIFQFTSSPEHDVDGD